MGFYKGDPTSAPALCMKAASDGTVVDQTYVVNQRTRRASIDPANQLDTTFETEASENRNCGLRSSQSLGVVYSLEALPEKALPSSRLRTRASSTTSDASHTANASPVGGIRNCRSSRMSHSQSCKSLYSQDGSTGGRLRNRARGSSTSSDVAREEGPWMTFYYYTNAAGMENIRKSRRLRQAADGTGSGGGIYFTTLEPTKYLKEYIKHSTKGFHPLAHQRCDADFVVRVEIPRNLVRKGDIPGCWAILVGLIGGTMHRMKKGALDSGDVWKWNARSLNLDKFSSKIFRIKDTVEFEDMPSDPVASEPWYSFRSQQQEKPFRRVVSKVRLIEMD